MNRGLCWMIALTMFAVRLTCVRRVHNDRRQDVLDSGKSYIYGQLHAHQVAAGMFGEAGTVAMVSRSADGDIVAPMLKIFRKQLVRGSSGPASKGGASALQQMIRKVRDGHRGVIAVDGPKGPRGTVQKGIGLAAKKSGMPVMPVILVPNRRIILSRAWDRFQIPMPFSRVDVYFGDPISVGEDDDLAAFAKKLAAVLHDLEAEHDPTERSPRILEDRALADTTVPDHRCAETVRCQVRPVSSTVAISVCPFETGTRLRPIEGKLSLECKCQAASELIRQASTN